MDDDDAEPPLSPPPGDGQTMTARALDFLMNISFGSDTPPRQSSNLEGESASPTPPVPAFPAEEEPPTQSPSLPCGTSAEHTTAGSVPVSVVIPQASTHSLAITRSPEKEAIWGRYTASKGLRRTSNVSLEDTRVFVTSPCGTPSFVFSVLGRGDKNRLRSIQEPSTIIAPLRLSEERDRRRKGVSFANLLHPSNEPGDVTGTYDPNFLDDPAIRSGKHRTVMKLASYMTSVVPFVRPGDLKAELNEQFALKHPWINPQTCMTLSKVRRLKRLQLDLGVTVALELSTVAYSHVYLERLILQNKVSQHNRKLIACICLFLAIKFSDPPSQAPEFQTTKQKLQLFLDVCPFSKKEILSLEFAIFASLSFSLHCEPHEVLPHLQRILQMAPHLETEWGAGSFLLEPQRSDDEGESDFDASP